MVHREPLLVPGGEFLIFLAYIVAKSVVTCFQILKPTMNKWAQYPAQMEA